MEGREAYHLRVPKWPAGLWGGCSALSPEYVSFSPLPGHRAWGCGTVFTCQRRNTGDAWLAQSGLRIPSECRQTGDSRQPQSDNPGAGFGKVSRWQPGVAWQEMWKGKPDSPVMSWPVRSMGGTRMRYRGAGLIPGNGGLWGFTSWDRLQRGLGEASG